MIFDNELVSKARELLTEDVKFADELQDVATIDNILDNQVLYSSKREYLIKLNNSLCAKYPEINIIDNLSKKISWKIPDNKLSYHKAIMSESAEISNLRMDRYCILARVLKSAGKIVELVDFFDKAYIETKNKD
jgi:hypothetical protein